MIEFISKKIQESISVKEAILKDNKLLEKIEKSSKIIIEALQNGNKIFFCGNGGSAADAQHLTAEFLGRFYLDKHPLPAISLTANTSTLTALGNDFSYDDIFLRQLMGLGKKGDILAGISTSGNSGNIVNTMKYARKNGIINIAFTGESGGKMRELADVLINVPSKDTPRIQEAHITIGHIICEIVEKEMEESRLQTVSASMAHVMSETLEKGIYKQCSRLYYAEDLDPNQ